MNERSARALGQLGQHPVLLQGGGTLVARFVFGRGGGVSVFTGVAPRNDDIEPTRIQGIYDDARTYCDRSVQSHRAGDRR